MKNLFSIDEGKVTHTKYLARNNLIEFPKTRGFS